MVVRASFSLFVCSLTFFLGYSPRWWKRRSQHWPLAVPYFLLVLTYPVPTAPSYHESTYTQCEMILWPPVSNNPYIVCVVCRRAINLFLVLLPSQSPYALFSQKTENKTKKSVPSGLLVSFPTFTGSLLEYSESVLPVILLFLREDKRWQG